MSLCGGRSDTHVSVLPFVLWLRLSRGAEACCPSPGLPSHSSLRAGPASHTGLRSWLVEEGPSWFFTSLRSREEWPGALPGVSVSWGIFCCLLELRRSVLCVPEGPPLGLSLEAQLTQRDTGLMCAASRLRATVLAPCAPQASCVGPHAGPRRLRFPCCARHPCASHSPSPLGPSPT